MAYDKFVLAKTGSMTSDIALFTEFKENWQYFFSESSMTPDSPGSVDKVVTVKQHLVRRGPGDPNPYTKKGHERFYARSSKSKGSARPGSVYTISEDDPTGPGYRERRQFSLLGNDMDILAYARNKARFKITIKSPNGWSEVIQAPSGPLPQAAAGTDASDQPVQAPAGTP